MSKIEPERRLELFKRKQRKNPHGSRNALVLHKQIPNSIVNHPIIHAVIDLLPWVIIAVMSPLLIWCLPLLNAIIFPLGTILFYSSFIPLICASATVDYLRKKNT